jgi:hypothetical protein
MPLRFNASRNGPFGLCQAEAFGNSLADSVSFRFPSRQSLDGPPFLRRIPLRACHPADVPPANKKEKGDRPLPSLSL